MKKLTAALLVSLTVFSGAAAFADAPSYSGPYPCRYEGRCPDGWHDTHRRCWDADRDCVYDSEAYDENGYCVPHHGRHHRDGHHGGWHC